MTRDEIISMAREAGFLSAGKDYHLCDAKDLERFAALVAARECEMCAKVCNTVRLAQTNRVAFDGLFAEVANIAVDACVEAIRARGEWEVTK